MTSDNYGDFISSYLAENFATGEAVAPNPNNPKTQGRRAMRRHIATVAEQTNVAPDRVALGIVGDNVARVDRYIATKGETPAKELKAKAWQAYQLRQREVGNIAQAMQITPSRAAIFLDEAESKAAQVEHPDVDNFLGEIFTAIGQAVQPIVDASAAKRAKAGKPAGALGLLATGSTAEYNAARKAGGYDKIGGAVGGEAGAGTLGQQLKDKATNIIAVAGKDIADKMTDSETKRLIKKYWPVAAITVIVIIAVAVFISRRKK